MKNTNQNSTTSDSTWAILGALRFFLAFIVLSAHANMFAWSPFIFTFVQLSAVGAVIGFFIISGYSIAASCEKDAKNFYKRRFIRIYPVYLFCLILAFLCGDVTENRPSVVVPTISNTLANSIFLQNYFVDCIPTNGCVWSIAFEVLFYILAPFFNRLSTFKLSLIGVISATLFIFYCGNTYYPFLPFGYGAALLIWAWLLGFIAYRIKNVRLTAVFIGVVSFFVLTANHDFLKKYWWITFCIIILSFFFSSVRLNENVKKVFLKLGDVSYPLFLVHFPVFYLIEKYCVGMFWGCQIACAVLVAFLINDYFDKPAKKFLKKLLKV